MTRRLNFKKDARIIKTIQGETPAMLRLRLMISIMGHNESNGMSRIYTTWSKNNK